MRRVRQSQLYITQRLRAAKSYNHLLLALSDPTLHLALTLSLSLLTCAYVASLSRCALLFADPIHLQVSGPKPVAIALSLVRSLEPTHAELPSASSQDGLALVGQLLFVVRLAQSRVVFPDRQPVLIGPLCSRCTKSQKTIYFTRNIWQKSAS